MTAVAGWQVATAVRTLRGTVLNSATTFPAHDAMQALDYLKQLIPFPSVSSVSNVEISDCVEQWLRQLGFEIERLNYLDIDGVPKSNVIGRKGPAGGCGLAYFGHTDVVPVNSWSFPPAGPWTPHQTADRLYGRGSCDMRGSLACMLAAIESLGSRPLKAPLYYIATADEEVGMPGARYLVQHSAVYREIVAARTRSIIGEPTRLEVVHAHKGGCAIRATSVGRAAHSSTGLGRNANFRLIPFLAAVAELNAEMESSPAWRDERFSPPTPSLNLVIQDTNTGLNITSARSECRVYFRPMPGQDADGVVDRLRGLAQMHGLTFELLFAGSPLYTDPDNPFIVELLQIAGRPAARTVAYGTDGAVLTELKDIAVIGPGDIAQAHTDDEWIALDQLELGTDLYRRCIERWCC